MKRDQVVFLLFSFFILGLAGCGGDSRNLVSEKIHGLEYVMLDKGTLVATPGSLTGTGSIIFRFPRPSEDSNFELKLNLPAGGECTLITNTDNTLSTGVKLTFGRNSSDGLTVKLLDGATLYDLSEDFTAVSAAAEVSLSIDVHGHGHIVIFQGGEELEYAFASRPPGFFWGMKLSNATLTSVRADKAKDAH